ncbi:MAG TPA: aldehyde dehydrogenase family protein [Solirubrobacteraceae bacterium]|jgi:aldehyde dehydrogenase (NAD+)|nr:aldehyde dehydrogenase family protein [Solirubrobacteraceae bacterium]
MSSATIGNLLDGVWATTGRDGEIAVTDPSNVESTVAVIPAMSADDIAAVYDAAERGAKVWRHTRPLERARVLSGAAKLLRERTAAIAPELVSEMGKTLAEATVEVTKAADFFDYYASLARLPIGVELADGRPNVNVAVRNEPIGIVVAITPWNDPLLTPARKLAPALFAGNAVILKPATETPVVSLRLAEALNDAGLPAGVLGTVTGRASRISSALLGDDRLAAVTFTGSTSVGMQLHRELAGRNIRLQTEMGGKNASVVLADADLDLAAETIVAASFGQAGQRCTATSRVIVDRAVVSELLPKLVEGARRAKLGPGLDPETNIGPVVSRGHQAEVIEHLERARNEGAEILTGGGVPAAPELANGCYVEPTVIAGVTREMSIWRDEVFGPAIAVIGCDGVGEAVELVNDSVYGLSAAVFTKDIGAAAYFEEYVDTGQVSVNLPTSGWDVHHPFGGFQDSGSPFKEQGLEALRFYTRVKSIAVRSA